MMVTNPYSKYTSAPSPSPSDVLVFSNIKKQFQIFFTNLGFAYWTYTPVHKFCACLISLVLLKEMVPFVSPWTPEILIYLFEALSCIFWIIWHHFKESINNLTTSNLEETFNHFEGLLASLVKWNKLSRSLGYYCTMGEDKLLRYFSNSKPNKKTFRKDFFHLMLT